VGDELQIVNIVNVRKFMSLAERFDVINLKIEVSNEAFQIMRNSDGNDCILKLANIISLCERL
jgi:uncharacterized Rmd1/YagE family protein